MIEKKSIIISSRSNEKIISLIKNKENDKLFFVEGIKLTEELLKNNFTIKTIVYTSKAFENVIGKQMFSKLKETKNVEYLNVTEEVFEKITDTEKPQGIAVIAEKKNHIKENIFKDSCKNSIYLMLCEINDPGNLGSIIRTAKAANITGIFLTKGSVSIYNPKVIRATMGAIFNIKIVENIDAVELIKQFKLRNVTTIATDINTAKNYFKAIFKLPACFIFGNEANGLNKNILEESDLSVKLPILTNIDSLNVGVSAGIMIYEALRRFKLL